MNFAEVEITWDAPPLCEIIGLHVNAPACPDEKLVTLAERFGITPSTVHGIRFGHRWKGIE